MKTASDKMWNKVFEELPTKCCTAVGTDSRRLVIVFDINYTTVLFKSEQRPRGWEILVFIRFRKTEMVALREDETTSE